MAFVLWFFGIAANSFPLFAFVFGAAVDALEVLALLGAFTGGILVVCIVGVIVASVLKRAGRRTTLVGWLTVVAVVAGWIVAWNVIWAAVD